MQYITIKDVLLLLDNLPANSIKLYLTLLLYGNHQTAAVLCQKSNVNASNFHKHIKPLLSNNMVIQINKEYSSTGKNPFITTNPTPNQDIQNTQNIDTTQITQTNNQANQIENTANQNTSDTSSEPEEPKIVETPKYSYKELTPQEIKTYKQTSHISTLSMLNSTISTNESAETIKSPIPAYNSGNCVWCEYNPVNNKYEPMLFNF